MKCKKDKNISPQLTGFVAKRRALNDKESKRSLSRHQLFTYISDKKRTLYLPSYICQEADLLFLVSCPAPS